MQIEYIMTKSATAGGKVYKVGEVYQPQHQDSDDPRLMRREQLFLENYTRQKPVDESPKKTTRKRSAKKES